MSNNLRQIAKDLRSFVKRCKDVHYSDSLLISFLITGLLTIAPKLHADVASEQQEITAQTYDAITDLRQSFMRARKENEKSLKGAQSELVQLLKQGDQVIKSPWASFQFGTGYTNNDWGTTYRGRGGKFLEYYKRDNDLTKYVFDKDKHLYGATNLNIPRNQEPDVLTINPANMHEPYKPYTPDKMENIKMPDEVNFNAIAETPDVVTYSYTQPSYTYNKTDVVSTPTNYNARRAWSNDATVRLGTTSYYQDQHWPYEYSNSGTYAVNVPTTTTTEVRYNNTRDSVTSGNLTNGTFLNREQDEWNSLTTAITGSRGVGELNDKGVYVTKTYTYTHSAGSGSHYSIANVNVGGTSVDADDLQVHDNLVERKVGAYNDAYDASYGGTWGTDPATVSLVLGSGTTHDNNGNTIDVRMNGTNREFSVDGGTHWHNASEWDSYKRMVAHNAGENAYNSITKPTQGTYIYDTNNYSARNSGTSPFSNILSTKTSGSSGYHRGAALYLDGGYSGTMDTMLFNINDINETAGIANTGSGGSAIRVDGKVTDAKNVIINLGKNSAGIVLDVSDQNTNNDASIIFTASNNDRNIINLGGTYQSSVGGGLTYQAFADNTLKGASAGGNIAFNIQDGMAGLSKTASITGPVELNFESNQNIGYNVTNYTKKITITNKNIGGGSNHSSGIDLNGAYNVVYSGGGIADTGSSMEFDDVNVFGDKNTVVYLSSNSNPGHPVGVGATTGYNTNGNIGYFLGNITVNAKIGEALEELKFGTATSQETWANTDDDAKKVSGNVGVYALSGQRADTATYKDGNAVASTGAISGSNLGLTNFTPANISVKDSNFRFGKYAQNNTGIYAGNGSVIDANSTGKTISDGLSDDSTKIDNTGNKNVMFYSTGTWKQATHNLSPGGSLGAYEGVGSQINVTADKVIMTSYNSTTYSANDSGIIKVTGDTVAQGKQSTIAYSKGLNSQIILNGNMIAADENLFGPNNNNGTLTVDAFNNVGAYAYSGGLVKVSGSTADTSKKLELVSSYTAYTNSMIYGLGAVADGNISYTGTLGTNTVASKVDFDKGVAIATGTKGGLLARNNGLIEFTGNIINQDLHALIPNLTPTGNTHEKVSPFYADSAENYYGVKNNSNSNSKIDFTDSKTNIYMHDGLVFTGYDNYTYYKDTEAKDASGNVDTITGDDLKKYNWATYRGMKNVTYDLQGGGNVDLGLINNYKEAKWDSSGTPKIKGYLDSLKNYTGAALTDNTTNGAKNVKSTLINGKLTIDSDVNLEKVRDNADPSTLTAASPLNDIFNNIKMESELVTINSGKNIKGDVAKLYRAGQGLRMANSQGHYNFDESTGTRTGWLKTSNADSGYINKGTVDVWGGTAKDNAAGTQEERITGLNVAFGRAENDGSSAKIKLDHGFGIYGTDGSILKNVDGADITVTGKYTGNGTISFKRNLDGYKTESDPSGENYGIAGISDTNEIDYNRENFDGNAFKATGNVVNTLTIDNTKSSIKVEGKQAVGIYGENRNKAEANKVTINYETDVANSKIINVENTTAISKDPKSRGIGIALINNYKAYGQDDAQAGGEITLKSSGGTLGGSGATSNDILTGRNGIGIYAESANIFLNSNDFTVQTAEDGIGMWVTDDSNIAKDANTGHNKTFQYNYQGSEAGNGNGFAIAFGSTNSNGLTARNDLDIKFNNAGKTITLVDERAGLTGTPSGTSKGIAGILVNTGSNDTVINKGHIKEEDSTTNVRSYGAVVNRGKLKNYGNITLNDSLMPNQASDVKTEDMKKVNIGIFANNNGSNTRNESFIENYGDITIGKDANSAKNIGSWAIYGYNVTTGAKEDGTQSKITINRNSYGIYSGDGNVDIQKGTKLLVGNDKVLGHVQHTQTVNGVSYTINRQNQYANANDLLSGLDNPRERDSSIGVYIDSNKAMSNSQRTLKVGADMDIDRYSYGIVLAEKNGGATTNVELGSPTEKPIIRLAYSTNNNAGGHVKSTKPSDRPILSKEVEEQGNAVYYYSADTESRAKSYANITMDGDYNTAYYTKGSVENYGDIDLRSQYNMNLPSTDPYSAYRGYGNVGIASANANEPSINYGTITTGMSDTENKEFSIAMGAGRNKFAADGTTTAENPGYIINKGTINVQEKDGIGMFATGHGSKAINYGNINLYGENSIGMYLDNGAMGENHGTIKGNGTGLKGVLAINGGYIKNYGTIKVEGDPTSYGIVTDDSRFIVDAAGNVTQVLEKGATTGTTVKTTNENGSGDLYGGSESSIKEGTSGNPKTTGVGTTITMPNVVPLTKISVDGIDTPIFNVETDAANIGDVANNITVSSSIQTGGTRIIDLNAKNEWGNPVWPQRDKPQLSEITSIGMYVDTSGVRYTNPIDGIQNLPKLGKVDLYFGPEATMYTNSKAIRIGDKVDANGTVTKSNILKPFNDALSRLPGGAKVNVLSGSLTWQVLAKLDSNNQLSEIYMSKVPYHSFAYDNDKSLVNFTNNLDNIYEIARPQSAEKIIFNKLNSLGNGEGHILAQAFDQMRGHIYGGVQQRIKSTSDILTGEMNGLRSDRNVSKDSNKFKAFGQRNEFKTDTAGMPDWYSNAGGFAFVHEDETVRLGQSSGWSAGVVNNYFTFKDLSKSYENQAMAKVGVFKTIPLDANGTFVLSLGGDGFFGRNDMKRRFWVVDQEFRAKASYYSYGAGLNAGLEKAFVINDGFSIVPNVGIRAEYGRFSSIHENGDMALNVKSDDYVSVKPSAGIDFRYSQEVFKNSNLTASLGFAYENEIGKLYDIENEARIVGAWTDYFGIRGDKEDKRGNFKSDLKLGLDNGRFGFNVNTGYDSKGHNFRAGLGLKVLY